jgi:pSer/pThr/pTyr-binding forkhead associated (FHA) protein
MATTGAPITSLRVIISGAELTLGLGEHVLGRASECGVFVADPLASRRHAAITVTSERVTIRDLGSRNGVLVNGNDVDDNHGLFEGDLITIGSQAIVVLQIARAGQAEPGRSVHKPAPLGRIAVQKQLKSLDTADPTTTLNQSSPLGRPISAFRMIAEAADLAIATHRADRAEKILEAPLLELLATLRAGLEVEGEIIDLAVQKALTLCEITRQKRWEDYVHDLYDRLRIPMPLDVADRLALVMQR